MSGGHRPSRSHRWLRMWPARRRDWIWVGLTFGILINALRLRSRLERLAVVGAPSAPGALDQGGADQGGADQGEAGPTSMTFVTSAGVVIDEATRHRVEDHARRHRLDVVDLVPADLGTEQALDLVRQVDPAGYRDDALAQGASALHAAAVRPEVLERLEIATTSGLDPVEMATVARRLKLGAPRTTDLAVCPGLASVPAEPRHRLALARAVAGRAAPGLVGAPLAQYGIMAAGLVLNPVWGLASLAASAIQPLLVTTGTAIAPRDAGPARWATRPLRLPQVAAEALGSSWEPDLVVPADPRAIAQRRPVYTELLASGTQRFFEARRETCPWCGGGDLRLRIETPDLLQHKPGTFRLDECGGCSHVFQNPRLTIEGLDFYYRDAYDGLAADEADAIFGVSDKAYLARVRMVTAVVAQPRRWLDVGGGHGHFCLVASGELPATRFDGLDMSESIDEAARRGWVSTAYRGLFPELADSLAGAYDVVSMHHYMEHTRDPLAELDAAATVLEPGGHLLIELPDPDSVVARAFGRYWGPWFQPQHQHLMPLANLVDALAERGFEVLDTHTGEAHQPADAAYALWNVVQHVAPPPTVPWLPEPTAAQRAGRAATFVAASPALVGALVADTALAPLVRRTRRASNAYRVLARRAP